LTKEMVPSGLVGAPAAIMERTVAAVAVRLPDLRSRSASVSGVSDSIDFFSSGMGISFLRMVTDGNG